MNLANPDCARAVRQGVRRLIERFDFDGVNLAELYFESLEGAANPARFTPMNDDVRREFRKLAGFDPLELFDSASPRHLSRNPEGLKAFLDYRARLAARLQREWLAELDSLRSLRPPSRPGFDARGRSLRYAHARGDRGGCGRLAAPAGQARLHVPGRGSGHGMASGAATLCGNSPALRRAGGTARAAGAWTSTSSSVTRTSIPQSNKPERNCFSWCAPQPRALRASLCTLRVSLLPPDLPLLAAAAAPATRLEPRGDKLIVEARQPLGRALARSPSRQRPSLACAG
jgi:hypothetical protein